MDFIAKRNKLRRRKLLVLINAVCTATIHWKRKAYFKQLNSLSKKIDRDGNIYRDRENMLREINAFPDYIFRSMFRVDRSTFEEILSKITRHRLIAWHQVPDGPGDIWLLTTSAVILQNPLIKQDDTIHLQ